MLKQVVLASVAMALVLAPSYAYCSDALEFGPAGTWIKPLPAVRETKLEPGAPAAFLGMDIQSRFGDGDDHYIDIALKILTPQGLAFGRPTAYWNPQTDTVTIHKVHILRGDQVIDVLAQGQTFTTLRRESNLDRQMLDGNLTAVLQTEGLQVGDILTYSLTIHRKDPVLRGKSETLSSYNSATAIGRVTYRAVWDGGKPMRWKATSDLSDIKVKKTAAGTELSLELKDYKSPEAQPRVPDRYKRFGQLQLTEFASWPDLSGMMAPLYTKASTLAPESPLRAEVDKIRAAYTTPGEQAAAVLRLVEEQVRYVYIGANQGNYVPADADLTWQRRYGDCKGKTALLLALLRELGIESDAVLVSTKGGDGMNESLPLIELFDHVIVRAVVEGKTYWLDGTRMGDTRLDQVPVPAYAWGLPVKAAGGDLVAITPPSPAKPLQEKSMRVDASGGLDAPAPFTAEVITRGDPALAMHTAMTTLSKEEFDKQMKETMKDNEDFTLDTITTDWDAVTGEFRIRMDGKAKMNWWSPGSGKPRQYAIDGSYVGGGFDLERKDGPAKDAPVRLVFPHYEKTSATVVLPQKGKGFAIAGEAIDTTLAGYAMKRSFQLKDGVFTMEVSERTVAPEVAAAEVLAAEAELDRLGSTQVYLQMPFDYKATATDVTAAGKDDPKTVDDYVARAETRWTGGQLEAAIADLDSALKLDPKSAKALVLRGQIKDKAKDYDGALADYAAALAIDRRNTNAYTGQAFVYWRRLDYPAAIDAVTRVLDINPADPAARYLRGLILLEKGDAVRALDDALANVMMQPDSIEATLFLATAYQANIQYDKAVEVLQAAITKNDKDARLHAALGEAFLRCATQAECDSNRPKAVEAYNKAIALEPSVDLYLNRARVRPESERAARFSDIDAALALQPDSTKILLTRGQFYRSYKDYDLALADADAIQALEPDSTEAYSLRANIYADQGNNDAEFIQLDKALALKPEDPDLLNNACWSRATSGRELARALELCNAALTVQPRSGQVLDSRGMVHLKMGKWDEALADYDAAVTVANGGPFASAWYGRGIAKMRKGLTKEGKADLAEARRQSPGIEKTYAEDGIKP
ncbi:tetratricopeptide repeat protein [Asticcacaulis biprosthecium]|nr:tetratricopeptide repeat protein [Asticcacaulis biprosthecium]